MNISIKGAREHNLKNISVEIHDGLTVVTGISGSGKTSLVFDTLYHEANRRFMELYALGSTRLLSVPARVDEIHGLSPAVAIQQNVLNRNPASNLASASGLHPFLRLLYTRFGERLCPKCGYHLSVLSEDEVVEKLIELDESTPVRLSTYLVRGVRGSHRSLLEMLSTLFPDHIQVDGLKWAGQHLAANQSHDIEIILYADEPPTTQTLKTGPFWAREMVHKASSLGAQAITIQRFDQSITLSWAPACIVCGNWFNPLETVMFHTPCKECGGSGCKACAGSGLHPEAAATTWHGMHFNELLALSVDDAAHQFATSDLPSTARRLQVEIMRRLEALQTVGLGYISLDRPSPSVSRGEAQRIRLAVALTSRLEDMLHILDEPTIGQHPSDVQRLLTAFRQLPGPVVFVEHDRQAAAAADHAIDLGPGAGLDGGDLLYDGSPSGLWQADSLTGQYFSLKKRVSIPKTQPAPDEFLIIRDAHFRNLKHIDVSIPYGRITVVTGVSGSGKSTLIEDVLAASLETGKPIGCSSISGRMEKPVVVDQSPIGLNPRSNPATYTKLADLIRDFYSNQTGLSPSHFSFNRPEGSCPECNGMGAQEVQLRYLPSTWIPCDACGGQRFSEEVLAARVNFDGQELSIADFYNLPISTAAQLILAPGRLTGTARVGARSILGSLRDVGLGYLTLGQPSPTLSGGEAQRVKLTKYLGRKSLDKQFLILDEPSTGLHPHDINGLLIVIDRLVRRGATIVIIEHNTDIIRAADWIIELGPGAGPRGGQVLYLGAFEGLMQNSTPTSQALYQEASLHPFSDRSTTQAYQGSPVISVKGARANNLQNVDVDFPKNAITVVTGVSGSGKSSLVSDVLDHEARRRYLESLSMYERQSTREGPEAPVDSISGLGVTITISSERTLYERRATVGSATEISTHLAVLLAELGQRNCPQCGNPLKRDKTWHCANCQYISPLPEPRHFSTRVYAAACLGCHGVGTRQVPEPQKLIIHPGKPLLSGAMYSPGFFPQGYLGKPYNGGHYLVLALAERYNFDPFQTPWDEMATEAQQAFLFGDERPMPVTYHSRKGRIVEHEQIFPGFYGWIRDWDIGGTYTRTEACQDCGGSGLREEFASVQINQKNLQTLNEIPLVELLQFLYTINMDEIAETSPNRLIPLVQQNLATATQRCSFLVQVGLGYLNLTRPAGTLSAGEAQRIRLASLLGSGLTSLTVLLDEPTRGLHPDEVDALIQSLLALRDSGNTLILVEHDLQVIRAADHLVDMGLGAGWQGGQIVAQGKPQAVAQMDTITGGWLRGDRRMEIKLAPRTDPSRNKMMVIRGARGNNLKGEEIHIPLGCLTGICGVSGSGKSTLVIDTLGRALAPKKQTTSVAYEPVQPGEYEAVEGAPDRVILVDQVRTGIGSPAVHLGLNDLLAAYYAESEDAHVLGLDAEALSRRCSACGGKGVLTLEMGFLPNVHSPCDTCHGTGLLAEAREVHIKNLAFPDVFNLTIDQAFTFFEGVDNLTVPLSAARDVGLGYLVLRQPDFTLSGGEAQRLKIAREICRKTHQETLYILDEPTVGQHLEDVSRLIKVLRHLGAIGHSILVVEHHPHLLAACDWLLEIGPVGGPKGGWIIAQGTPQQIAAGSTPTAPYIRQVLEETA